MKARVLLLSLLVLGLFVSPAVLAQSATTALLTGQVVDKEGQPMPGVTVTAVSAKSAMQPAGTVTDADGRYRLTPLTPADDYVLTAVLPGFAKVEVSPIDLDPGKATTQNITLVPSTETTEKVTIVAKGDIVDVASTKTATVFNSEFIEGLPIIGRSYQDILTLAPGVTDVDGDGNPNVNGARSTDFQTRVDGVNTTDPVSGTFGQNLNLESIAEIEVITTGASAEFSQAQGGFANIITKSGGNDFEGNFKFFYRSDLFDNDGANNSDIFEENNFGNVDGFEDMRPFLTFGGPIVKDRLWYFFSLQWINQETPINTLTGTVKQGNEGWNNFGKFTYQPAPSHRLSLSANWDPREFTGFGLGTAVDPESDFIFDQGGLNTTLSWTYNISPALLLEMRLARQETGIKVTPVTSPKKNSECNENNECNPFAEDLYTVDNNSNRVFGPYFFTQDDERTRNTLRADLSIFVEGFGGTHNLKTGFEFAEEAYENTIEARRIRVNNRSTGGSGLGTGSGNQLRGTISFIDSFPDAFGGTGCIPAGAGSTCDPQNFDKLESEKDIFGLYVQDSFKPRPNLTINVGLRLDREDATTDGFTPFNPQEESEEFLALLIKGQAAFGDTNQSIQDIIDEQAARRPDLNPPTVTEIFTELVQQPKLKKDVNGDHRDLEHCGTDFGRLDLYTNSLVTGFGVNPDGTYFLVGDEGFDVPDGEAEDFFAFQDNAGENQCRNTGLPCDPANGNADCPGSICGDVDGTTLFDTSLVGDPITIAGEYSDPDQCDGDGVCDRIFFDPAGNVTGEENGDGQVESPNCDRRSEDTLFMFEVFSRHQLDLVQGPIDFPAVVPGFDNGCPTLFDENGTEIPPLPGSCRQEERFNITNNNVAPRLSVSWDPWANNKTKLFATWSRFYDKLFLATLIPELGPDVRVTAFDSDEEARGILAQPFNTGRFTTTQVDRDMETPYSDEFTIGFERELAPEWSLQVTYIHREGRNQLQDIDVNHVTADRNDDGVFDDDIGQIGQKAPSSDDPGGGTGPAREVARAPDGQPDLFALNPLFNQVLRVGNFNWSEFDSAQVIVTRRLSRQWQMTASYVWSEAKGQAEAFQAALGNDPGTQEDEAGFLSFDQTHVVKFNAVTFLPGDQSLGAAIQWSSGLPFSLILQRLSGDNFDSVGQRTTFPTGQRNDQRNEGRWNVDISYSKNLTFGKYHASVGVSVFDLLNSDDLRINQVDADPDFVLGLNAGRDFGRRWEAALEFHF